MGSGIALVTLFGVLHAMAKEDSSTPARRSVMVRLSIMNFLQFFVWGLWFVTIGQGLGFNGLAEFIPGTYGTAPYGVIFAPLFLGLIADRFFPSQIIFGV